MVEVQLDQQGEEDEEGSIDQESVLESKEVVEGRTEDRSKDTAKSRASLHPSHNFMFLLWEVICGNAVTSCLNQC